MPRSREVCFWAILIGVVLLPIPVAFVGYYSFAKLTYSAYSCGSFAQIDSVIGWVIAPNRRSCMGGRTPFSRSSPWYEASVYTDSNGFRNAKFGGETAIGGVMAIGDSWTFGYGVSFEQSFPGHLALLSKQSIIVAASPAYSSAQALLLAERWIDRLRPSALVYLDLGMWERAACRGSSRPSAILKPCYWQAPGASSADLVVPPPGRVERLSQWGIFPGGMIGAGEVTWPYFLISRPYAQVTGALVAAGLMSGMQHDFSAVGVDGLVIRAAVQRHLLSLSERTDVPLIVLDPNEYWTDWDRHPPRRNIHRVGRAVWETEVAVPARSLPDHERSVPNDGHFGNGANRLVAQLVANRLALVGAGR